MAFEGGFLRMRGLFQAIFAFFIVIQSAMAAVEPGGPIDLTDLLTRCPAPRDEALSACSNYDYFVRSRGNDDSVAVQILDRQGQVIQELNATHEFEPKENQTYTRFSTPEVNDLYSVRFFSKARNTTLGCLTLNVDRTCRGGDGGAVNVGNGGTGDETALPNGPRSFVQEATSGEGTSTMGLGGCRLKASASSTKAVVFMLLAMIGFLILLRQFHQRKEL